MASPTTRVIWPNERPGAIRFTVDRYDTDDYTVRMTDNNGLGVSVVCTRLRDGFNRGLRFMLNGTRAV